MTRNEYKEPTRVRTPQTLVETESDESTRFVNMHPGFLLSG